MTQPGIKAPEAHSITFMSIVPLLLNTAQHDWFTEQLCKLLVWKSHGEEALVLAVKPEVETLDRSHCFSILGVALEVKCEP